MFALIVLVAVLLDNLKEKIDNFHLTKLRLLLLFLLKDLEYKNIGLYNLFYHNNRYKLFLVVILLFLSFTFDSRLRILHLTYTIITLLYLLH